MAEVIQIGDLTARHLGIRTLIIDGNTVVEGTLQEFWFAHDYKGVPKCTSLQVKVPSGKFDLKNVPIDFTIQVGEDDTP